MPNKELRIAIADARLSAVIQIEKALNRLGYYRILPIQFSDELWILSDALDINFDVLIGNRELVLDKHCELTTFFRTNKKVNHALLYGDQQTEWMASTFTPSKTLITCTAILPSDELIEEFMACIDPPSPWKCLEGMNWIKNRPASNTTAPKHGKTIDIVP